MRALDERIRQLQFFPQCAFLRRHRAIIGFVIVSGQMQHSMQDQHLQLVCRRMAIAFRVFGGNLGGDGDISAIFTGKREHIRRLIFFAKTAVQPANLAVAGNQDGNFTGNSSQFSCPVAKAEEIRFVHIVERCFQTDHLQSVTIRKQMGGRSCPPLNNSTKFLLLQRFLRLRLLGLRLFGQFQ